jgi:hypothetical protein
MVCRPLSEDQGEGLGDRTAQKKKVKKKVENRRETPRLPSPIVHEKIEPKWNLTPRQRGRCKVSRACENGISNQTE